MLFVQHLLDVKKNIEKYLLRVIKFFIIISIEFISIGLFSEIIYFMRLIYCRGIADNKINSKD